MRAAARENRKQAIEEAALTLLQEQGYDGMSMLGVAKRAKASNETLYRWYGDKRGLFKSLVERNASIIKEQLQADTPSEKTAIETLKALGPSLIQVLTGPTAIALNRAAASDASGDLGTALASAGRHAVLPPLCALMTKAQAEGFLSGQTPESAVRLYISVLIGDLQVRQVTGASPPLMEDDIVDRANWAWSIFSTLSEQA